MKIQYTIPFLAASLIFASCDGSDSNRGINGATVTSGTNQTDDTNGTNDTSGTGGTSGASGSGGASAALDLAPISLLNKTVRINNTTENTVYDLMLKDTSFTNSGGGGGSFQYRKTSPNTGEMTYSSSNGYSGTTTIVFTSKTTGTFRDVFTGVDSGVEVGTFELIDSTSAGGASTTSAVSHENRKAWLTQTNLGGSGTIIANSADINGKSYARGETVTVNQNERIKGSISLEYDNQMSKGAVVVNSYTWSWAASKTSGYERNNYRVPVGRSTNTVDIDIEAPQQKGTYYILFSFSGEFLSAEALSMSNWSAGKIIWNDGNDVLDIINYPTDLSDALMNGQVKAWPLYGKNGYYGYNLAVFPMKIVVQ